MQSKFQIGDLVRINHDNLGRITDIVYHLEQPDTFFQKSSFCRLYIVLVNEEQYSVPEYLLTKVSENNEL